MKHISIREGTDSKATYDAQRVDQQNTKNVMHLKDRSMGKGKCRIGVKGV